MPGVGSTKPFSALVVDVMMDREVISKGQCFPRYRYERPNERQKALFDDAGGLERVDNIPGTALRAFRVRYADNTITKDAIFDYVYGVLHAPGYRERFANDLAKELPRIPFAPDFHAFAEAGAALSALHLGYETGPQYPLETVAAHGGEVLAEDCRIGDRAMRFADDAKTTLIVNDRLRLARNPAEAHGYEVNGRTPPRMARRPLPHRDGSGEWHRQRSQRVVRRSARPDRGDPPGRPSQRGNDAYRGGLAGAVPRGLKPVTVDALTVTKDTVFWDSELFGFGVSVYPSGSKFYADPRLQSAG